MSISRNVLVSVFLTGMAASVLAGEDAKHVMAVEVMGHDSGEGVHFFLDSDDLGFDLDELQVGETRSVVDESGKSILITRNEDGYTFNVDGEIIELPHIDDEDNGGMHWVSKDGDNDISVRVVSDVKVRALDEQHGTVIVSPKPIDEATQQAIKSVLESAGYDSEVEFIDSEGGDHHNIKVKKIEKIVENPQT